MVRRRPDDEPSGIAGLGMPTGVEVDVLAGHVARLRNGGWPVISTAAACGIEGRDSNSENVHE
jgi:hypothetical protein